MACDTALVVDTFSVSSIGNQLTVISPNIIFLGKPALVSHCLVLPLGMVFLWLTFSSSPVGMIMSLCSRSLKIGNLSIPKCSFSVQPESDMII